MSVLPSLIFGCGRTVDSASRHLPASAGLDAAGGPTATDAGIDAYAASDGTAADAPDGGPSADGAGDGEGGGGDAGDQGPTAPPNTVDPSISGHWSWQKCGSIAPTPLPIQAQFLPTGELVVSNEDGSIVVHAVRSRQPVRQLAPANGVPATFGVSLDGTLLATADAQAQEVALLSTVDGSVVLRLAQPPECSSGAPPQFSAEGDSLFVTGGASTCIWRTADGSRIADMPGSFFSAAIRGGQLLAVEGGSSLTPTSQPALLTYTVPAGPCAAGCAPLVQGPNIPLQIPAGGMVRPFDLRISPRGDIVAGQVFSGSCCGSAVWRADGSLAYSSSSLENGILPETGFPPVYSPAGERVLLTDRIVNMASFAVESALTQQAVYDSYSTIDSSGLLAASTNPRDSVALFDLPTGKPVEVVGALPPPNSNSSSQPTDMAASSDGVHLLVRRTLWRIDPDFAQSNIVSIYGGFIIVDDAFSPDGTQWVASGDGYEIFTGDAAAPLPALPRSPGVLPMPGDCFVTPARLAPHNDRFLLGNYSGRFVSVLNTGDNTEVARLPATACARAVFNADETLVVTSDPALYRVSDWSQVWIGAGADAGRPDAIYDDVQIRPNADEALVSHCGSEPNATCVHAMVSLTDGSVLRSLPALTSNRAKFSPEGNWIVSGSGLFHLPDGQQRVLDPQATLATFMPNGDVIAVLADNSLARYCRAP